MALPYPIAMPPMPPGPKSIQLIQNFIVGEHDSPFTGQSQIYEHQGSWWSAKVDLPYLTRAQAAPWLAFLGLLNGRSGTFLFGDPTVLGPIGSAGGVPSVNPAGQTGKTLAIASLTGTLKAGDYFQIGGENRLLWSQAFDNLAWTYNQLTRPTADTIVAPDGTTTAEAILPTGGATDCYVFQNFAAFVGQTYTFSVWLRVPSGTKTINIGIWDQPGLGNTTVPCNLTTSWTRFAVTRTVMWNTPGCYIGTSASWTAGEVDAWGGQAEPGAAVGVDYFPTTSAPQASTRRLHMNLGDISGNPCTLNIFPRLRESPIASFSAGYLIFAKPQGQFRLDSNAQPFTVDKDGHYSISFGAKEAF
jgi:hypothetical protein